MTGSAGHAAGRSARWAAALTAVVALVGCSDASEADPAAGSGQARSSSSSSPSASSGAAGAVAVPDPSASAPAQSANASPAPVAVTLPPAGAAFDYQLGGAYPPPAGVQVVARDATQPPAPGLYGICYVNGFQTQPDESARWWSEHRDLVLAAGGRPVADPGWPDEYLLDTSTADKRTAIAAILADTVRGCATAGYRAVELDNLDSWTRSGGRLTSDDALDLAARLIAVGHGSGLAVAQKNAAELGTRGRDAGFDLAVTEECHRWDECADYAAVYGDHVLDIEYSDDLRGTWADACADPQRPASMVLRDRLLTAPGDSEYAYERC